jgi:hypothetical protein
MEDYERSYFREAYNAINEGDIEWLRAELWKDSRWVTMISTTFFSSAADVTVPRWQQHEGKRIPLPCSLTLRRYSRMMGAVDQFNRELAATCMQMGRW